MFAKYRFLIEQNGERSVFGVSTRANGHAGRHNGSLYIPNERAKCGRRKNRRKEAISPGQRKIKGVVQSVKNRETA